MCDTGEALANFSRGLMRILIISSVRLILSLLRAETISYSFSKFRRAQARLCIKQAL